MAVVVASTPASYSYFIGTCCPLGTGWVSTPVMVCCVVTARWVMVVVPMVVLMVPFLLSWWYSSGVIHVWEGRLGGVVVFIVHWAHVTPVFFQVHVVFAPFRHVEGQWGLGRVEGTRRRGLMGGR